MAFAAIAGKLVSIGTTVYNTSVIQGTFMLPFLNELQKARHNVQHHIYSFPLRYGAISYMVLALLLTILAGCGTSSTNKSTPHQVLRLPNVGIAESASLDPALGPDANTGVLIGMIYSGLVRSKQDLTVLPDQATWSVSPDNKVYTFHLKPHLTFSDGIAVTAQTYVYTLTRALLPAVKSPIASFFEANIAGQADVSRGKTSMLRGVKALNAQTLQITLTQPAAYFLQELTNPLFFPVNPNFINAYGQQDWPNLVAGNGVGTGPFILKTWERNVKMVFTPNPLYYGTATKLAEVDMFFVNDPATAYKSYRAGQYDIDWNITADDQQTAKALSGFTRQPQLQTDILFFNTQMSPFDTLEVRQAFAYAADKTTLAHTFFQDAVIPAPSIIPPGMPGYQPDYKGIEFDKNSAKTLLQTAYPDVTTFPPITFSYPSSLLSQSEANFLKQQWENTLGISVTLQSVEPTAYNDELMKHQIQFGFTSWSADFADPYDCLALNLLSTASANYGQWSNSSFDETIAQAEKSPGSVRLALYTIAEQIAVENVGWLPLDHQTLAAVIPSYIHGITLNGNGLYFGDWSGVYVMPH